MKGNESKSAFISFSESGLFNGLQRIQIKNLPPRHTVSQMSHATAEALGSIRRVGICIARIQLLVKPMSLLVVGQNCTGSLFLARTLGAGAQHALALGERVWRPCRLLARAGSQRARALPDNRQFGVLDLGGYFAFAGANIGLPLAVADAGTSSCMTSQCSATFPSASRKMSTAIIGFGAQPT
jgi:hypothetical protein